MRDGKRHASGLPQAVLGTQGEPGPQVLLTESARDCFAVGVRAFGYQDAFAAEIGISKGNLSDMLSGARHVQFRHVLALLSSEPAARVVLARQCDLAGFMSPQPKTTIALNSIEAAALADVRRIAGPVWKFIGAELAARRYGTTLDLLDVAIDYGVRRDE